LDNRLGWNQRKGAVIELDRRIPEREIISLLTLRYYPVPKSPEAKNWQDLVPKHQNIDLNSAAKTISGQLKLSLGFLEKKKAGLTISGGIDSSLLLSIAMENKLDLTTFSVLIDGKRDPIVSYLLDKYPTNHHDIMIDRILEDLPAHIGIVKKPLWHLWSYYLLKYASGYCRTLCTGDGGDELFGGYVFRYRTFLDSNIKTPLDRVKAYLEGHSRDWVPDQEKIFGPKLNFRWDEIYSLLLSYFDNPLEPLDQVFLADYNGKLLHDWYPMFESWATAFDLEISRPLLDSKITAYALRLPHHLKYSPLQSKGKLVLRKILEDRGLSRIALQGKTGFAFDTVKIWENEGKAIFVNLMEKSRVVEGGLINREWVQKTLESQERQKTHRYINKLLGILSLEVWYRIFITGEMKPNEKL